MTHSHLNVFPLITSKDNPGKWMFAYVNELLQLARAGRFCYSCMDRKTKTTRILIKLDCRHKLPNADRHQCGTHLPDSLTALCPSPKMAHEVCLRARFSRVMVAARLRRPATSQTAATTVAEMIYNVKRC